MISPSLPAGSRQCGTPQTLGRACTDHRSVISFVDVRNVGAEVAFFERATREEAVRPADSKDTGSQGLGLGPLLAGEGPLCLGPRY